MYCVHRENVAADKNDDANTSHLVGEMEIMRKVTFVNIFGCDLLCMYANDHEQVDQDNVEKKLLPKISPFGAYSETRYSIDLVSMT